MMGFYVILISLLSCSCFHPSALYDCFTVLPFREPLSISFMSFLNLVSNGVNLLLCLYSSPYYIIALHLPWQLPAGGSVLTSTCCAFKHCSNSLNFIWNSGDPKNTKSVRLNFGEMLIKWCTWHLECFYLIEWHRNKKLESMKRKADIWYCQMLELDDFSLPKS